MASMIPNVMDEEQSGDIGRRFAKLHEYTSSK